MATQHTNTRVRKYGDRASLQLSQASANQKRVEKQSTEVVVLEFGSWQGSKDTKPLCGIDVMVKYEYESGRSCRLDTVMKLSPNSFRDLAKELLRLADEAEKGADA